MELVVAFLVALILNIGILAAIRKRYDPELARLVAFTYIGTIVLRYLLAIFLWMNHTDPGFNTMFWGDSQKYDAMGAVIANGWGQDGTFNSWTETMEGRTNSGWIYFVATVYYVFGRNPLLVQFINGIIGALTAIVILEIGLLVYDRRAASWAMLLTAFFPQMIFWSSALYKDTAVMFCIGANILATLQLKNRFGLLNLLLYVTTAAALLWLRFYIFYFILAATFVGFVAGHRRGLMYGILSQTGLAVAIILLVVMTPVGQAMLGHQIYLDLELVQVSRADLAEASSGFATSSDVSTFAGALSALPLGVIYVLFAPFPWAVGNLRQALALPDVLLWYALIPALLRGLRSAVKFRLAQIMPILLFTTALTLAYGIFQGNVGTAYRQRTQIMMFYFIFVGEGLKKKQPYNEEVHWTAESPGRI